MMKVSTLMLGHRSLSSSSFCECELWPVTLMFKLDFDRRINHYAIIYLGKCHLVEKLLCGHTDRHTLDWLLSSWTTKSVSNKPITTLCCALERFEGYRSLFSSDLDIDVYGVTECNWTEKQRQLAAWAFSRWKFYQYTSLRVGHICCCLVTIITNQFSGDVQQLIACICVSCVF